MESGFLIFDLWPLLALAVAYGIGTYLERRHFKDLLKREARTRSFPVITFATVPAEWEPHSPTLVSGSVVVSVDYFKRFVAWLRSFVGGRVKTYEPILDRARREAVLRMVEGARRKGFHAVINVRIETSRLANSSSGGKGTAGVELLAFGTAIKRGNA